MRSFHQDILDKCCKDLKIEPCKLVGKEGIKWVITSENDGLFIDMLKLEKLVQKHYGSYVDLRLEPREDKNKRVERTGRE